jgi:methyl-accepting chemotaxis protein
VHKQKGEVMNDEKVNQRKKVMIDKYFQIKLIIKFILINALVMLIFSTAIYLFMHSELDANLKSAHAKYASFDEMLFPIVAMLSVVNLLVSSVIIAFVILIATFRIAGPIYRFNEVLKSVAQKNLNPMMKLRKKDQLEGCAESLGDALSVLRSEISEMKITISNMEKHPEYGNASKQVKESFESVKGRLDKFVI